MNIQRNRMSRWIYVVAVVVSATILLFWLEWLGSERPMKRYEVPVEQPAAKQKTRPHVEK